MLTAHLPVLHAYQSAVSLPVRQVAETLPPREERAR